MTEYDPAQSPWITTNDTTIMGNPSAEATTISLYSVPIYVPPMQRDANTA